MKTFETFKNSQGSLIFSDSIIKLCDSEKRRIYACSNGSSEAWELSKIVGLPIPEKVFSFDRENAIEIFEDGSLYVKSSGDSEVWAFASDYFFEIVNPLSSPEPGLREFFGAEPL